MPFVLFHTFLTMQLKLPFLFCFLRFTGTDFARKLSLFL